MSIKPKFYGIKKGRSFILNDNDKLTLGNYLTKFEDGKEMEMTVAPKYKRRTSGQPGEETNFNGYLWGVLYKIIGDEIGEFDLDYIHYWAQIKVGNVKGMRDGSVIPAGTGEMSGGEFADYCQKVRVWASAPGVISDKGMYLPEPNEAEYGG
jgi:hypothetical protein